MIEVNIAEFKAHLAKYLEKSEAGEEITLRKYNRPLAKLVPISGPRPKALKLGALRGTGKWLADPSESLIPSSSWEILR